MFAGGVRAAPDDERSERDLHGARVAGFRYVESSPRALFGCERQSFARQTHEHNALWQVRRATRAAELHVARLSLGARPLRASSRRAERQAERPERFERTACRSSHAAAASACRRVVLVGGVDRGRLLHAARLDDDANGRRRGHSGDDELRESRRLRSPPARFSERRFHLQLPLGVAGADVPLDDRHPVARQLPLGHVSALVALADRLDVRLRLRTERHRRQPFQRAPRPARLCAAYAALQRGSRQIARRPRGSLPHYEV